MPTGTGLAATRINPGRRQVIRGLGSTAVTAGLAAPRIARAARSARVLKMGYIYVHDSQLGACADEFSRRVEAATGGAFRIEQYPSGRLGGEVELIGGMRRGDVDLAVLTAVVFAGVVPEFGIFDLPFLFRDVAHARAILDSPMGQEYLDKFHDRDVVALAWGETGMRHFTNSKHPIREPADLRGLRLRVPQSDVMLRCFRQLGADAAVLPFPALYGALESGRFDGQENPIATICASHFERVQKHLTLSGHIYCSAIIFISKDCWDDFDPAEKTAFIQAARAGGLVSRAVADQAEKDGTQALAAAGMEIVPGIERVAFRAALEPTWSEFARQFGETRIAHIRSFDT